MRGREDLAESSAHVPANDEFHCFRPHVGFVVNEYVTPVVSVEALTDTNCALTGPILEKSYVTIDRSGEKLLLVNVTLKIIGKP
jgi:hypothetical protein